MLQNQKKMAFIFLFFFSLIVFSFHEYKFYMELGALHYIAAVVTLHAEYLVHGALTKDVWEDKNPEFTSEIQCFGALQSPCRVWFQKETFLDWVANGTGWVLGARR